jgi:glyoxylase-like metal-dependent hydrolase (beta-lactamase superfamily II)
VTPVALQAYNPGPMTGDGTRTWWLDGRVPTLIDAGSGDPRHVADVASVAGDRLSLVLVTHAHSDHVGGVEALARRWPRARFAKLPWPERDARHPVTWSPLADGDTIPAGDDALVVVHTPGHAPDHVCFWEPRSRALFTGDLLVQGQTVLIPASRGGRLADYLRSLERIIALDPIVAYPAHGPDIARPADLARSYLRHRLRRERQVIDALAAGGGTPAVIASRIYEALPETLRAAAEESVLAHLAKLEEEGRARRTADSRGGEPAFVAVQSPPE